MDFDDGKRVLCGLLRLRGICSHGTASPQQVLTAHSRHFSSHAHPGTDPRGPHGRGPGRGLPLLAIPGGRAAGQSDGGGGAQTGSVACEAEGEELRLGVPWTVTLVERVGRCGSIPETMSAQHAEEGFLELLTGARVDDGVDTAVEIAEPKGYLEHRVRRLVCREDGT